MFRVLGWLVRMVPLGWCARDTDARIWRNRRGGRVVFLGDVAANFGALFHSTVYRVPKGSAFIRGKDGGIEASVNRREPE